MLRSNLIVILILNCLAFHCAIPATAESWECQVLPSEREIEIDPDSGARLTFLTTSEADDGNLYFHQRSFLPDGSVIVIQSNRFGRSEPFGYIESTGELFRMQKPDQNPIGHATAARFENCVYVTRDQAVYEWKFDIQKSNPDKPSKVVLHERKIADLPKEMTLSSGISDNSDGTAIVVGYRCGGNDDCHVDWINKATGEIKKMAHTDYFITHIEASNTQPDLVMFAKEHTDRMSEIPEGKIHARMTLADLTDKEPWPIYPQIENELVTHECWWVDDRLTFCSGTNVQGFSEEIHVKEYNLKTGITRIIGAGSWWDNADPKVISHYNWWHASGAPNGRFVAGDNWHGDIAIFSALTCRRRMLTHNHRTYGEGAHPHVGWGPKGDRVIFASNRRGNVDVVVAELPESWMQKDW